MKTDYSLQEIRDIMAFIEPYLTIVNLILDKGSPILDKIFSRFAQYMREENMKAIRYYESQELTIQDAILLTINSSLALQNALENMKNPIRR